MNTNDKWTKEEKVKKIGEKLKEVGLDSRFEWLQGNGIDDDLGKGVPEWGSVWIKGLLG